MELEILKKSYSHILTRPGDVIKFIDNNKGIYPIRTMCKVLHLPKSTYYKSHHYVPSQRTIVNKIIKEKVIEIYNESKHRYSAPKIQKSLEQFGYYVSIKRVQRLMK